MDVQETAKQAAQAKAAKAAKAAQAAKAARKPQSEPKLSEISVKPTGARTKGAGAAARLKQAAGPISVEQRRQQIAEAAYFRAVSRGFEGGDPVADWLDAEREVDSFLGKTAD